MTGVYTTGANQWLRADGSNGGVRNHINWLNGDAMAFVCNQYDDCPGFNKRHDGKGPGGLRADGGWLMRGNPTGYGTHGENTYYVRRDVRGPKAEDHKGNEPSVLQNPETKVTFHDGGNYDGEAWKYGRGMRNGAFGGEDRTASITIPLGYKFIGFSHYTDRDFAGNWREGSGDSTGVHYGPKLISGNDLNSWGMADKISSFIIEQVPFDVNQYWDTMTNSQHMVTGSDAQQIKEAYCKTPAGIQNDKCISAGLAKRCPASSLPCYSAASDLQCPAGYDTKDIPNNKCYGYTVPNVAQVNCPTGFTRAAGNSALCSPDTGCVIAPGYQGAGGAC